MAGDSSCLARISACLRLETEDHFAGAFAVERVTYEREWGTQRCCVYFPLKQRLHLRVRRPPSEPRHDHSERVNHLTRSGHRRWRCGSHSNHRAAGTAAMLLQVVASVKVRALWLRISLWGRSCVGRPWRLLTHGAEAVIVLFSRAQRDACVDRRPLDSRMHLHVLHVPSEAIQRVGEPTLLVPEVGPSPRTFPFLAGPVAMDLLGSYGSDDEPPMGVPDIAPVVDTTGLALVRDSVPGGGTVVPLAATKALHGSCLSLLAYWTRLVSARLTLRLYAQIPTSTSSSTTHV
jgi:hypothetical protein